METFQDRLDAVNERIAAACGRSGRNVDDVGLVAVAKRFGPDAVTEAAECGITVIGENRVQEAKAKIPMCPGGLEWHFIGNLQRNKVRDAVRLFVMLHAVDSIRLLEAVEQECAEAGVTMPVCLEVNISGEAAKHGFKPDEIPAVLERAESLMSVDVAGLMTMPPFSEDPEHSRSHFARMRELRDKWSEESGFPLAELSMGMSNDLEVAIEEGSTRVRVGTSLFGRRSG